MLSGANPFETSDIERMNTAGAPAGCSRTLLHALWLLEIAIRQPHLGNFPQTFVQLAHSSAAFNLHRTLGTKQLGQECLCQR